MPCNFCSVTCTSQLQVEWPKADLWYMAVIVYYVIAKVQLFVWFEVEQVETMMVANFYNYVWAKLSGKQANAGLWLIMLNNAYAGVGE